MSAILPCNSYMMLTITGCHLDLITNLKSANWLFKLYPLVHIRESHINGRLHQPYWTSRQYQSLQIKSTHQYSCSLIDFPQYISTYTELHYIITFLHNDIRIISVSLCRHNCDVTEAKPIKVIDKQCQLNDTLKMWMVIYHIPPR